MSKEISAQKMIDDGLSDFFEECFAKEIDAEAYKKYNLFMNEERLENEIDAEAYRRYDLFMNEKYKKIEENVKTFVKEYLSKNPQEICGKCHFDNCLLNNTFLGNRCGDVGLKVEGNFEELGELEIKTIPRLE